MKTFPATLPDVWTYNGSPTAQVLASNADDMGVIAYRRRSRQPGSLDQVGWTFLGNEYQTFIKFWRDDLLCGTKWFYMRLPSGAGFQYVQCRFADKIPSMSSGGFQKYDVTCNIEVRERAFGPTDEPDPYWDDVVMLLHGQGADGGKVFTDSSDYHQTVNGYGTAVTSKTQAKFGSTSIYLYGQGNYLDSTAASLNLQGIDYTVESWVWMHNDPAFTNIAIIYSSFLDQGNGRTNLAVNANGSIGTSEQDAGGANASRVDSAPGTFSFDQWHHCALTKAGTMMYLHLDGILSGTVASPVRSNWEGYARIGRHADSGDSDYFYGYVQEVRVTKRARYISNFDVPTKPFPNF